MTSEYKLAFFISKLELHQQHGFYNVPPPLQVMAWVMCVRVIQTVTACQTLRTYALRTQESQ